MPSRGSRRYSFRAGTAIEKLAGFGERRRTAEWMDDPALGKAEHFRALRGLARINTASRTGEALWHKVAAIAATSPGKRLKLLDVACGGGDVTLALALRARRRGVALEASGCDISSTALEYASARAAASNAAVRFFSLDALRDPIPARYDIVTTTLFLHHLANADIVALLAKLARHADHLLVSDLLRGPLGWTLAWAGPHLLSTSPVVHVDALRSVCAALSLAEVHALVAEAGLHDAHIERAWPRRFMLYWRDSQSGA